MAIAPGASADGAPIGPSRVRVDVRRGAEVWRRALARTSAARCRIANLSAVGGVRPFGTIGRVGHLCGGREQGACLRDVGRASLPRDRDWGSTPRDRTRVGSFSLSRESRSLGRQSSTSGGRPTLRVSRIPSGRARPPSRAHSRRNSVRDGAPPVRDSALELPHRGCTASREGRSDRSDAASVGLQHGLQPPASVDQQTLAADSRFWNRPPRSSMFM